MKPLIRWVVPGHLNGLGCESLEASVASWQTIYGDLFDYCICVNRLNKINRLKFEHLAELVNQEDHLGSLCCKPFDTAWKLYPPRLRQDSHEIIVDNDLILHQRSPSVDAFLAKSEGFVVTSAHRRFYGQFDSLVDLALKVNTGLMGFPPGYDLGLHLNWVLKMYTTKGWQGHCDEEGAVTFLMSRGDLTVIPMDEICVCNPLVDFAPYRLGTCGTHFAGLNSGGSEYWFKYKSTL